MIDLTNKSAANVLALLNLTPTKCQLAAVYAASLHKGEGDKVRKNPELLKAFRTQTGGAITSVFRSPREESYREITAIWGRRSGKTSRLAVSLILEALFDTSTDHLLAPGEKARIFLVAPFVANTKQLLDLVDGALALAGYQYRRTTTEIEVEGRPVIIQSCVANELAPRGYSVKLAVIDEAQGLPSEEGAAGHDEETLTALRGACINLRGRIVMIATPWTRQGVVWKAYDKFYGKTDADTLILQAPTWVVNPRITEDETRKIIPDKRRWSREFKAEFGSSEGQFLEDADVMAAVMRDVVYLPRDPVARHFQVLDFATRHDLCVLGTFHIELQSQGLQMPPKQVLVCDRIKIWEPPAKGQPVKAEEILRELVHLNNQYGKPVLYRDIASADVIDAWLRQYGIKTKELSSALPAQASRFHAMATRFRNGTIKIPDNEEAIKELTRLKEHLRSNGRVSFSVPEKHGFDDVCDVIAGACDPTIHATVTPGGDLQVEAHAHWDPERGVTYEEKYFTLHKDAHGNVFPWPAAPPPGTPASIRAALERRAQGLSIPGDDALLEGVDPNDYADVIQHVTAVPDNDPLNGPGVRFRRSMQNMASSDEVDAAERSRATMRTASGRVYEDTPGVRYTYEGGSRPNFDPNQGRTAVIPVRQPAHPIAGEPAAVSAPVTNDAPVPARSGVDLYRERAFAWARFARGERK